MDSSFWFDTIILEWSIVYTCIEGSQVIISNNNVFIFLKIVFVLANSEMLHYLAFHLGLHCLLLK